MASIAEYYGGKVVAVTGATGFIGQCLLEKLLRSCPGVRRVFLLVRGRGGRSPSERVRDMLAMDIFANLRKLQPSVADKLVAIECDIEKPGFDISPESLELIHNEVQIFIHSAATLKFNEHLRLAFTVNTLGVRTMLEICRGIKHLEACVHISTAYSFCDRERIGESVYQTGWDFDKLHDALRWMSDDMVAKLTPDILRKRPNTYTLTKAFGEEVLVKEGGGLPLCIVRPSIVGAAMAEPVPGWCSNLNGPTGLFIGVGKGLLRTLPADEGTVMDIMPADLVVNGILAAGWRTGVDASEDKLGDPKSADGRPLTYVPSSDDLELLGLGGHLESSKVTERRGQIPIYNLVASKTTPITYAMWNEIVNESYQNYPLDHVFRLPSIQLIPNKHLYWVMSFLKQNVPAFIIDAGRILTGHKPMLMRLTHKMNDAIQILHFFISQHWDWDVTSVANLHARMSEHDKKTFSFDPRAVNWGKYMENYAKGTKKFILKENLVGYPAARRRLQRLRVLGYVLQTSLFLLSWRLLVPRSDIARNLWQLFISLWSKFIRFFSISSTLGRSSLLAGTFSRLTAA